MDSELTIEDILKGVPRFRILCVGRAGVGKSSLINRVFGITGAKVSQYQPGDATIEQEFVSDENKYFILHDSMGFEPGNEANFDLAARFLRERSNKVLLRDRLHAIWLCIETPRAGGRVLEEGDKKFLALAHELQTPVLVVFTKYDFLVKSKYLEEEEEEQSGADEDTLRERSKVNASKSFAASVASLDKSMATLRISTPPYVHVSVSKEYEASIAELVDMTRRTVHDRLRGDAWVTWAIAQRANLPMKISACVDKGVNYYYRALSGSAPGVGNGLLWQCLAQVHQDIVTCWNFRDQNNILVGTEFQQLILYLVEEVHTPYSCSAPSLDRISQFVNLINASTIAIAPPVAILGLTYFFVKWVADTVLNSVPEVECLLMAYTIDLISVLKSLFDFTLKPDLAGETNWEVLKEAFEDYERSNKRKEVHASCRSMYDGRNLILTRENFHRKIKQLLTESLAMDIHETSAS